MHRAVSLQQRGFLVFFIFYFLGSCAGGSLSCLAHVI